MRSDSDSEVLQAHGAVHAWLEARTYEILEALVRLRLADARSTFEHMARVLDAHMAFEEARVLPAYRKVAPTDGPGRADHVDGDHTILQRHVVAIREMLDALMETCTDTASSTDRQLRHVLARLPVVYRLLSTLEHHTAREQQSVYPALPADVATGLVPELLRATRE